MMPLYVRGHWIRSAPIASVFTTLCITLDLEAFLAIVLSVLPYN